MRTPNQFGRVRQLIIRSFVFTILCALGVASTPAQAVPVPAPPPENILAGALIIPMDNVNQGNAAGTTFNLRAYGLANLLLQNGIPVKWVIKPGKSKDDNDFSANVTRIAGTEGVAGPASLDFAGGPFVVTRDYDTAPVRNMINTFNSTGTPVTVYKSNADAIADVRYTLTHIPKIAIGPDGGNFGSGVYQGLFDRAGIPNYTTGIDDINQPGACYTIATQGHQVDDSYVDSFRTFVESGGNLILQCASVGTFENNSSGHFQTTAPGYALFTSNAPATEINSNAFVFPQGDMPFNQFLGLLADQDGAVTEYAYAPGGGPANGNLVAARNSGGNSNVFVATVSQVNGPAATGGVVFEFGGHDYARPDSTETDSALAMINGQRMQLNAVFVPAVSICQVEPQSVLGYKSVRRINSRQGGPPIAPGDTLEWTIDYVNNTVADQFNFQVRDLIGEFGTNSQYLTLVPGSNLVTQTTGGATATRNAAFDGAGNDATADMLTDGAFLPVGGRIQLKVQTIINANVLIQNPAGYTVFNQTTARSATLPPTGTTKSDAIDATNTNIFGVEAPPPGSVPQTQNGSIINPTSAPLRPLAAEALIEGRAVTAGGSGINNALVTVVRASNGEVRTARTNALGFFQIGGLPVGQVYLVTVRSKLYRFPTDPMVLNLSDSITGLSFTGQQFKPGKQATTIFKSGAGKR
ncbi:MAG: carboxypeptidase regulatory-like domain-containing protein [Acidobacteria bacterium]|nr:carboxypeptidase regulatory-like domain-containing protein [Acidobacteriota bacterium]